MTTIPPISGLLTFYGGGTRASALLPDSYRDSTFVYGGSGNLNIWFSPTTSVQLDIGVEGTGNFVEPDEDGDIGSGRLSGILGGHAAWRDPQSHAFGLLGALLASTDVSNVGTSTYGLAGVEGQRYLGNLTLYGQAGYVARVNGPEVIGDLELAPSRGWFVRGQGRYFFTPNDKLTAEVGFARLHHNFHPTFNGDLSLLNWGVSYERRFGAGPWSAFVEYAGFRNTPTGWPGGFGDNFKATEHMVLAGVRAHFGDATLLAQDRTGATFDMPRFARAMSWGCLLVCNP